MSRAHRFTIYDALESKGYFTSNPANADARDPVEGNSLYKGPVQYPKMLYHPKGEERVTVPAEILQTPLGPKLVGEQRELIWMIVANEQEEKKARAEGWHDHPAKAVKRRVELHIAANPKLTAEEKSKLLAAIPAMSSDDRIKSLEAELARLTAEREGEAKPPATAPAKSAETKTAAA